MAEIQGFFVQFTPYYIKIIGKVLLFMLEKSGQNVTRPRVYSDSPFLYTYTVNPYETLKNALKKSAIKESYIPITPSLASSLALNSRIARSGQPISHAEVQRIVTNNLSQKQELIIPNRTLIPTKNLDKVRGKTFRTVNVQERMGKPLTQQQFRRFHTRDVQDIVYQIQEEDQMNKIHTYTTAATRDHLPDSRSSRLKATTASKDTVLAFRKQQQNQQKSIQLGPKLSKDALSWKTGQCSPPIMQENIPMPSLRSYSYSYNQQENQIVFERNNSKPYTFKKQQIPLVPMIPEKKYNLFSILDQCGNRGCGSGCWKGNEICAPKLSSSRWK